MDHQFQDTVAALTLVKEQYFPILNSILFGEGIFNDAVSILLFRSVTNYMSQSTFSEVQIIKECS
jgi:NhaP-type Na+/H+ or K+/H+ antiporter